MTGSRVRERGLPGPQEVAGRLNAESAHPAAEQAPEVAEVSGDEMRRAGSQRGSKNRLVAFGKANAVGQLLDEGLRNDLDRLEKPLKAQAPFRGIQVAYHLWALLSADPRAIVVTGDRRLIEKPPGSGRVVLPRAFVEQFEARGLR
jgi:hypothetical protein